MSNAAQNDLRDKMRLEARFRREIESYFAVIVAEFEKSLKNGQLLDVSKFDEILAAILLKQYKRVEDVFAFRLRNILPQEIQSTVEEDRLIQRALDHFNGVRSDLMAQSINRTTQENIRDALNAAQSFDDEVDTLEDGKVIRIKQRLVGFELILTAKAILKRRIKARTAGIVNTETQVPAETSKLTETEVLAGARPSIFGGSGKKVPVTKIWVTMGDSLVRDTHLEADGQEVNSNAPFIVGGFQLRVPGDSGLGAPLKETINCRCAAVFNDKEVVAIRFDKLRNEPFLARG